eukprot:SAG25_NODE_5494_length_653_cov_0.530686_1_plen_20_part_10
MRVLVCGMHVRFGGSHLSQW